MTKVDLDEVRKLVEAATSGPWSHVSGQDVRVFYPHYSHRMALASTDGNAEFIARSRTLLPAMAEELAAARACIEAAEAYVALPPYTPAGELLADLEDALATYDAVTKGKPQDQETQT